MKKIISVICAGIMMSACNHAKPFVPDEDFREVDKERGDTTFISEAELSDNCSRFISDVLSVRYSDGGILLSRNENGSLNVTMVELKSGRTIEFSGKENPDKSVTDVRLMIDDDQEEIKGASVEQKNESGIWIDILTPDRKHWLLVLDY